MFTNFKISCESILPLAHVRSRKIFYHISAHFQNTGFRSVSKPRRPVFIFRTGPTTNIYIYISTKKPKKQTNCALLPSGGLFLSIMGLNSPFSSPTSEQVCKKKGGGGGGGGKLVDRLPVTDCSLKSF